ISLRNTHRKIPSPSLLTDERTSGMSIPSAASLEYWEEFYDDQRDRRSTYDTLYGYEDFRPNLISYLKTRKVKDRGALRILHAGCGNSNVTDGLWRDGFRNIVNIDFSASAIELMAARWEDAAFSKRDEEEGEAMRQKSQQLLRTERSAGQRSQHIDVIIFC
ncbi:unnamed protein product, partial [Polarella glacialis]